MTNWTEVQLKDISHKITKGTTPTTLGFDFTDDGINYIKAESISKDGVIDSQTFSHIDQKTHEILKRSQIEDKDILLTIAGIYLGKIGLVKQDFLPANTNQAVAIVRINREKALPTFVKYFLLNKSTTAYLNSLCPQTAQPNLNLTQLGKLKFRLPLLPVQQKIAGILSAYDDLIENNNKRIALLEKAAEEIYREWFVRMRFPDWDKVKFVKGVPEGWENTKFKNFCLLKRGYDLPNENIRNGIYPVIASTSIKAYHDAFMAEPPVITTGRSGSLGIVLFTNHRAWPLNTALYVKNYFGNSPYYIYFTLKYLGLEKFNSGAGVPTLNRNHLSGLDIAVPDKKLQNSFDEIIKPMFSNKEKLEEMNEKLKQSRDLLLSRLISGKLSVEGLDVRGVPSPQL